MIITDVFVGFNSYNSSCKNSELTFFKLKRLLRRIKRKEGTAVCGASVTLGSFRSSDEANW